jgi:hypothetical protein
MIIELNLTSLEAKPGIAIHSVCGEDLEVAFTRKLLFFA